MKRSPTAFLPVLVALVTVGCSGEGNSIAGKCPDTGVPTVPIDAKDNLEPRLRIPQPQGWDRVTQLDSSLIRFAMRNDSLTTNQFAANAVVTFEHLAGGAGTPEQIFDGRRSRLVGTLKATDVAETESQVCGYPADTVSYTAPAVGKVPARKSTALTVIVEARDKAGDRTYVTNLTLQTADAANATYVRDSETILKGFQVLPPPSESP